MIRPRRWPTTFSKKFAWIFIAAALIGASLVAAWPAAHADRLEPRSITITDSAPSGGSVPSGPGSGTGVTYQVSVRTTNTAQSLVIDFCASTPIIGDTCTTPAGLDFSAATLVPVSGSMSSWTLTPAATHVQLSGASAAPGVQTFNLEGVTNPNYVGSFYARIYTFADSNPATDGYSGSTSVGSYIDYGGVALSTSNLLQISAQVPPYIIFCTGVVISSYDCSSASGSYINFGNLSPSYTSSGSSQILVATNAKDGYSVTDTGTTFTSGNNIIQQLASPDISRPGTSQFGFNLRANDTPAVGADVSGPGTGQPAAGYDQPDFYKFQDGDVIASASNFNDYRRYTVSYIVNVSKDQPAGVYVSTMTYIGLGNF